MVIKHKFGRAATHPVKKAEEHLGPPPLADEVRAHPPRGRRPSPVWALPLLLVMFAALILWRLVPAPHPISGAPTGAAAPGAVPAPLVPALQASPAPRAASPASAPAATHSPSGQGNGALAALEGGAVSVHRHRHRHRPARPLAPQEGLAALAPPVPDAAQLASYELLGGRPDYADRSVRGSVGSVELYEVAPEVEKDAVIIDRQDEKFPPLLVRNKPFESLRLVIYNQNFYAVYISSTPSSGTSTAQVVWKGQGADGEDLPSGRYTASLSSSLETVVKQLVLR